MTRREFHKATPTAARVRVGSHRPFHPTRGGNPGLSAPAFAPDGRRQAAGRDAATVVIWDVTAAEVSSPSGAAP